LIFSTNHSTLTSYISDDDFEWCDAANKSFAWNSNKAKPSNPPFVRTLQTTSLPLLAKGFNRVY
jgi:hypothetical protein